MRLEQGRFQGSVGLVESRAFSSREAPVRVPPNGSTTTEGLKERIKAIRFGLGKETEKDSKAKKPQKPQKLKLDGFEPFVNPKPTNTLLFVNGYNGNFAQNMELNRKAVERALRIAHLDGQVVLTSLVSSRKTSVDANPDGTVTAKRALFVGEEIEREEKAVPYYKVVNIPQGWRIEINDKRIREELMEKEGLGAREVQKAFIRRFNGLVKKGIKDCIVKEKLSSVKDKQNRVKKVLSLWIPSFSVFLATLINDWGSIPTAILFGHLGYNMINSAYSRQSPLRRKIDYPWEMVLPPVEIDKVLETLAYLSIKGRRLIGEKKLGA